MRQERTFKVGKGFTLNYHYNGGSGSISNINNPYGVEISEFVYATDTLLTFTINEVFIQIWVTDYNIKRTGSDE